MLNFQKMLNCDGIRGSVTVLKELKLQAASSAAIECTECGSCYRCGGKFHQKTDYIWL